MERDKRIRHADWNEMEKRSIHGVSFSDIRRDFPAEDDDRKPSMVGSQKESEQTTQSDAIYSDAFRLSKKLQFFSVPLVDCTTLHVWTG